MIVGTSTSCSTSCGSRTEVRRGTSTGKILGTSIACSGIRRESTQELENVWQLFHHLRRRIIESRKKGQDRRSAARCAAVPAPAVQTRQTAGLAARSAGLFFKAEELRLGCGEGVPDRRRVVQLAPPHPRPWQSSVFVRRGAFSLPRPLRRSSAHVSAMSGAVAADVAVQLLQRAAR